MNDKDSIIEYYRRSIIMDIGTTTYKEAILDEKTGKPRKDKNNKIQTKDELIVPKWTDEMKKYVCPSKVSNKNKVSNKTIAKNLFDLGGKLKYIFFSTKLQRTENETGRPQSELSGGGSTWERLVTYYLNMCLINTRVVVFPQKTLRCFDSIIDSLTLSRLDSCSEVDLCAITFPDEKFFTEDYKEVINNYLTDEETKKRIKREKNDASKIKELSNHLISEHFEELGLHILQCKTNFNDSIQAPMLWSLLYYLSRSGKSLDNNNLIFGKSTYTLQRLNHFSYAFVTVPSQKDGYDEKDERAKQEKRKQFEKKYADTNTPAKRAALIEGGCFWGDKLYRSNIFPIYELFNRNFHAGFNGSLEKVIEDNLDKELYKKDGFNYFSLLKNLC